MYVALYTYTYRPLQAELYDNSVRHLMDQVFYGISICNIYNNDEVYGIL